MPNPENRSTSPRLNAMSYCLNPVCTSPKNTVDESCASCGTTLRLKRRYLALKPIGQGGFGRTFLAVDLSDSMKPRCVIKQLYPQQQGAEIHSRASDLFRQEAQQLMSAGQFPSIPTFLDYFEQDGFQYLVQEFIEGDNLGEILKKGRIFKESEVKALLKTMLETVDFLHHRKIIHRDIKPANIILTPQGQFVLVDLGAAKLATGTALGQTGTVIGSAEYVAPEQLRGKAIFASDLYSLGATCVTLLTGMSPFSLFDTSTGSWEWRDYLVQNSVSDSLGKILDRLLIGPTKQRYGSAKSVLSDLERMIQGHTVRAVQPIAPSPSVKSQNTPTQKTPISTSNPPLPKKLKTPTKQTPTISTNQPLARQSSPSNGHLDRPQNKPKEYILFRPFLFYIVALFVVIVGYWGINLFRINQRGNNLPPPLPDSEEIVVKGESKSITDLIKPSYNNPVKPYKIFENTPHLESMMVIDGGNTIATGHIAKDGQFKLTLLDIKSEKQRELSFDRKEGDSYDKYYASDYSSHSLYFRIENNTLFLWTEFKQYLRGASALKAWNLETQRLVSDPKEFDKIVGIPTTDRKAILYQSKQSNDLLSITSNGEVVQSSLQEFRSQDCVNLSGDSNRQKLFGFAYPNMISTWNISTGKLDGSFKLPATDPQSILISSTSLSCEARFGKNQDIFAVSKNFNISTPDLDNKVNYVPEIYRDALKKIEHIDYRGEFRLGSSVTYLWDIRGQKLKYLMPRPNQIRSIAMSPDLKTLILLESKSNSSFSSDQRQLITVWNLSTGRFLREIPIDGTSFTSKTSPTIAFTPDGKTMIFGNDMQSSISLWNVDELRDPERK